MKKLRHPKLLSVLVGLFLISFSILVFNMIYAHELPMMVEQINNATIGVILTAIITVFLLDQQTRTEEETQKSGEVFAQKLQIYKDFLEKLHKILQDGEVTIDRENNVDELSELISSLALLRMHADERKVQEIFQKISLIIKHNELARFRLQGGEHYYQVLAENLLGIANLLKKDLYPHSDERTSFDGKDLNQIVNYRNNGLISEKFLAELFTRLKKHPYFSTGDWEIPIDSKGMDFNFSIRKRDWPKYVELGMGDYDDDRLHYYIVAEVDIYTEAKRQFGGEFNKYNWYLKVPDKEINTWDLHPEWQRAFYYYNKQGQAAAEAMVEMLLSIAQFIDEKLKDGDRGEK